MTSFDNFCQSCGMPMEKDPGKGGSNRDGSRSEKYCSFCYTEGSFNDGFESSDQMIGLVKDKLKEKGYGPLKQWFFTSHISELERWR